MVAPVVFPLRPALTEVTQPAPIVHAGWNRARISFRAPRLEEPAINPPSPPMRDLPPDHPEWPRTHPARLANLR
jgi:hypothetical protein